jgi:hypothetical protein
MRSNSAVGKPIPAARNDVPENSFTKIRKLYLLKGVGDTQRTVIITLF